MHTNQFNQMHQQYSHQQISAKNDKMGMSSNASQPLSHAQQVAQMNYKMAQQQQSAKLNHQKSQSNATKQLAMNGATGLTGRKGSMPEALMNPLNQILQAQANQGGNSNTYMNQQIHPQQRGNSYGTKPIQRQKQTSYQQYGTNSLSQMSQNMQAPGKLIKSHAKYFSQQNSPVNRHSSQNSQNNKSQGGVGQNQNYALNNPQIQKQHQKHLAYQQQYLAQKQSTQTGMGTIAGMDQNQQLIGHQAKYQGAIDHNIQGTLDFDNLNTIGASSTVAQNMENDYLPPGEYHQYKQSLEQRRHSHQGANRQQQQFRPSYYGEQNGAQNLISHSGIAMSSQYMGQQPMLAYNQATGSQQMAQANKQGSKQKMNMHKNSASSDMHQYQQRQHDNQYRTNVQQQMIVDGVQQLEQYVSLPQQPTQEYIKKYHSQNQGPVLSNTAQNQTVVTTTNNSFIVSQTLSHGPQNSSHQYKNVKQKYDESFLNNSINNVSNAAINESSILTNNSQIIGAEHMHGSLNINQTMNSKTQTNFNQSKRQTHNNSVVHQPHHHQMPGRVGYEQKNYGQMSSNQHSMMAHKAQKRPVNSQMAMYNEQQKYINNDQMKSIKKGPQKSSELSGYRYKNMAVNNQHNSSHQHSQLSVAQHQRSTSGSGLQYQPKFQLKSNTKRGNKAQTRPVSNKKSQQQMVVQQTTAFADHMQAALGVPSHAHMASGDTSTIIRNKHAVSQSANHEMHQHVSLQPAQVINSALREKKKSVESTNSQSMIQYKKAAVPITTVPSQKKMQNSSGMNLSGSVLINQQQQRTGSNGNVVTSGTIIRSKTGQAQTTKTSPHRKQLSTPLDGSININMLHTNSTSQKMSDFKKGYQQNTFMHQPNTQPTQQSVHQDQPSTITLMPNQMLSKSSQAQRQQQHTRDQRISYTQYSNEVQNKNQKIKKNSSEMYLYQQRLSQHQQNSKQRTVSNNSSQSYQKIPAVTGSSNSRHSQKRKDYSGHQEVTKGTHPDELGPSSSEKKSTTDHDTAHQRGKGGHVQGQKQFSKKNNSITIQRGGNNEIVVTQNDDIMFDNMGESVRNYSATQRQQQMMEQNRVQHDANLQRNMLINKSISMNQIQPPFERKSSSDLAAHSAMFQQHRPSVQHYPNLKQVQESLAARTDQDGNAITLGSQSKAGRHNNSHIGAQGQMTKLTSSFTRPQDKHGGQQSADKNSKGHSDRLSANRQHTKSLNLNDSSNVHVEDSLRQAVVPQNGKNSMGSSVNYGLGQRPSGSSKPQVGRGSKPMTVQKHSSSKFIDQNNKSGLSQKSLRKYNETDGTSNKVNYTVYQSHSAKSQVNQGQNSKRLGQQNNSLSMSQMLIQKGINNRQTSHSSAGFHSKNQPSNSGIPMNEGQVDPNGNSQNQFTQLMAANGLMFKAAHLTIKGAHTTSANTAVNTAKNSPRIIQSKSKSIQSGGNKSHSQVGSAHQNNLVQQKSLQISDRQKEIYNKSYNSGKSNSKGNSGTAAHTIKPKSQQKYKNFGNLIEPGHPMVNYPMALQDKQHQPASQMNLNTIQNYPQDKGPKPLQSHYRHTNSNSQQNLTNMIPHQVQLNAHQSELLMNSQAQNALLEQHHQAYQEAVHAGSAASQNRVVKPHHILDGGTGSVSKLENSQDQIDSFHHQHSSKQQKQQNIERKTQNILKNAQRTAQILQKDQVMNGEDQQLEELVDYQGQALITEEDEAEIRQVASDINEKAFFGKILRTKNIIEKHNQQKHDQFDLQIQKLSPRSQEIAFVMKKINDSFSKKNEAPKTTLDFYRIGKMLGRGAFGKVNLAMHKLVRKLVALKSLNKECLTDEVQKEKLMKEVNLLLKLRHDNVVKIYETIETKKHIIIVMELCAGGDLLNYVRKRRRLKEPLAKKIFKQIIDGLQYIHSKYVAHRDIKLDNILLDGKGQVKIADFGVSKQTTPGVKMREQCGTPAYIAPEILRNKKGYTFSVDLWSAGVVLYAMLYGTVPFKAASMDELHSLILRGIYTLKDDISQEARDMLRGLLEINPHKRFNYDQINGHPWLADLDPTLQLFNQQEREMIKKEYTYNDPSRYNRNENEEPVDCFTEHNIDSVYNTLKNCSEKSIILAPFNSTQSEDIEVFKKRIKPMMMDKNLVLRLSRLCREIDRQYEFNNNGQLDNGVYHKQINNSAENLQKDDKAKDKKKDKKEKKDQESSEDDELKFQVMQCSRSQGRDFLTEEFEDETDFKKQKKEFMNNMLANMSDAEKKLIESTFGTNHEMELDDIKITNMVQYGYPREHIVKCLHDNLPNYTTAGYYLLKMDQNYC